VICLVVTDLTFTKAGRELRLAKEVAERANLAKDGFSGHPYPRTPHAFNSCANGGFRIAARPTLSPRVQIDLAMIRPQYPAGDATN